MPVGVGKIHSFLGAVTAGRAVQELIGSGIGLIQKGNELAMVNTRFTHYLFNLLGISYERWSNLRKTNAANEELVARLMYGCQVLKSRGQIYCTLILTA